MNKCILLATPLILSVLVTGASAQEASDADFKLPEACQQAAEMGGKMPDMGSMMQMMQNMEQMSDATKGYMKAMAAMHPPMMQGALAQDPDVAFNCSMIAHHQGAIAMARAKDDRRTVEGSEGK